MSFCRMSRYPRLVFPLTSPSSSLSPTTGLRWTTPDSTPTNCCDWRRRDSADGRTASASPGNVWDASQATLWIPVPRFPSATLWRRNRALRDVWKVRINFGCCYRCHLTVLMNSQPHFHWQSFESKMLTTATLQYFKHEQDWFFAYSRLVLWNGIIFFKDLVTVQSRPVPLKNRGCVKNEWYC